MREKAVEGPKSHHLHLISLLLLRRSFFSPGSSSGGWWKVLGMPSWAPEEDGLKLEALHTILYVDWKNKSLTGIYLTIFLIQGLLFSPTCLGVFFILAWFWLRMTYAWEVVYLLPFQNSFQCPLTAVWIHKTAYFNSSPSIYPFVNISIFSVVCDSN